MARTNIKVFDEGYQNIMGDDEYNLNVQRTRGVTPGIADPLMHNKLYRQTSIMAKALADYIVSQGQDCLDTDLTNITNALTTALETHTKKNKNILVTEAKTAANTTDWNTLTESRTYKITGATFAADKHQPVGAVGTGELVVLKNGDDTIAQVYYANSAAYDKAGAYHRMCIGGTWTDWVYNITNKGGAVTGDFDINGKLTVDSIEVSNQLTIGGAPPLGQDAIDKIQDQIISPSQNLYIDSTNGSDETGDGTANNPYKTINRAYNNIKDFVPNINFILENTTTKDYIVTGMEFTTKSNLEQIQFVPKYWDAAHQTRINLIIKYGKITFGPINQGGTLVTSYAWGTVLLRTYGSVLFRGLNISVENGYSGGQYASYLLEAKEVNYDNCNINLGKLALMFSRNITNNILTVNEGSLTGCTGFFVVHDSPHSIEDPNINVSQNIDLLDISPVSTYVYNSIVVNGTTIPSAMLENGDKGIDNGIYVIYKNWN